MAGRTETALLLGPWPDSNNSESGDSKHGFLRRKVTRDSGLTYQPTVSPDGKFVAYASDRSGEGHQIGRAHV